MGNFCSFGSFGSSQKNQKIKAITAKATNSHREAKISETRFAQTPRFLNASLGICLTLSPLMPFLLFKVYRSFVCVRIKEKGE